MLSKKDIGNVALWTSIIDVALATTVATTSLLIEREELRTVLKVGFNSMITPTIVGLTQGRHLASMRHSHNEKDIRMLEYLVLGTSFATLGILNAYASSQFKDMDLANCAAVGVFTGFAITLQTVTTLEVGLSLRPLGLPDIIKSREENADLKLKEVLSYNERLDKDIFETLERYNKVYKKMFVTLGTPYEMAKITKNEEVAKKIGEKNNDLVLQALLASKFARDNAMPI